MGRDGPSLCVVLLIVLWLAVNVADAFWLYYYVEAVVNPNPRNAVNRTSAAFDGYEAMMFIFGLPWGVVNMFACGWLLVEIFNGDVRGRCTSFFLTLFGIFVILPVGLVMTLLPFFGGWIVTPIVQNYTWKHRCDGYPMYAILDGKSYNSASYVKNVVYFYEQTTNKWLYTYEVTNPDDDDQWYFRLRNWAVEQAVIPLDEYPTLQSVGYNFVSYDLTGNCTLPASPSNFVGNTTTASCVSGTFDPGNHLFFNVTSTVPLNNTADAKAIKPTTTILRIQDNAWTYSDAPPALILHQADPETNALGQTVLRTAVAKPHDCTELKVCLAGIDGREGSQVGAEVMAPLGVMLMRQADYAIDCTTPSSD